MWLTQTKTTTLSICLLALLISPNFAQNWYDYEEQEEDHISQEAAADASILTDDDRPDIICAKDRMCKCLTGIKGTRDPNEVNCANAKAEDAGNLNTANLLISKESNPDFKAELVRLDHNDINLLRWSRIMPGQEKNIISLDFSFNRIANIERHSFDAFPRLVRLKLTHNRLRNYEISDDWLTSELGTSLHQLYLDYNYITELDDGVFDNLVNLTKLVLDGNNGLKLTAKTFGNGLQKLRTLSLDNCGLSALDASVFAELKELTQLSLSGNKFTSVPLALTKVPKLAYLALSDTPLTEVKSYAFKGNNNLKAIYMRKMPLLRTVNKCAFCALRSLETVDFTGSSQLSSIDERAFGAYERKEQVPDKMSTLLLGDCALETVSERLLNWEQISKFSLANNPLQCECKNMQWLMGNKQNIKFHPKEPTCRGPANVKGMSLSEANQEACGALPTTSSDKWTLMMVLLGLCGSIFIVGFFYARSKGVSVRHFLPTSANSAESATNYSHLTPGRGGGPAPLPDLDEVDDDGRLDEDFNRPEFV